jgi:hypothetical protein
LWKNVDISVTGFASDAGGSGLNFAKFRMNNANCWAGTNYNNGDTQTISAEGDHTLYLCGQDNA